MEKYGNIYIVVEIFKVYCWRYELRCVCYFCGDYSCGGEVVFVEVVFIQKCCLFVVIEVYVQLVY